jgi:1,4-alpha-glucan branching enzyme
MLHKKPLGGKKVQVTFTMPALPEVESLCVCGEFNAWSPTATPMARGADGSWSAVLSLDEGRSYRYRYKDERGNWHNDWHADWYIPNEFGTEDSVLDLSTGATMPQKSQRTVAERKPSRSQGNSSRRKGQVVKGSPQAGKKQSGGPSRGRRSSGRSGRRNKKRP